MKTILQIAVLAVSINASTASFADDNDWQHAKPNGGSYSNSNNGKSDNNVQSTSDEEPKKGYVRHSYETVREAGRQLLDYGSSDAAKAGNTSE